MAQPEERTLRELLAHNVNQQPVCITYPPTTCNFELKFDLIHILPIFFYWRHGWGSTQTPQRIPYYVWWDETSWISGPSYSPWRTILRIGFISFDRFCDHMERNKEAILGEILPCFMSYKDQEGNLWDFVNYWWDPTWMLGVLQTCASELVELSILVKQTFSTKAQSQEPIIEVSYVGNQQGGWIYNERSIGDIIRNV